MAILYELCYVVNVCFDIKSYGNECNAIEMENCKQFLDLLQN